VQLNYTGVVWGLLGVLSSDDGLQLALLPSFGEPEVTISLVSTQKGVQLTVRSARLSLWCFEQQAPDRVRGQLAAGLRPPTLWEVERSLGHTDLLGKHLDFECCRPEPGRVILDGCGLLVGRSGSTWQVESNTGFREAGQYVGTLVADILPLLEDEQAEELLVRFAHGECRGEHGI
jgi:hypothetical protein